MRFLTLVALLIVSSMPVLSHATSGVIIRPKIDFSVGDDRIHGLYKVLLYGVEHELAFSMRGELDSAWKSIHGDKVDLYFGAIAPGGQWISWSFQDGRLQSVPGFKPILRDHIYTPEETSSSQLNRGVRYQFTGMEPKGLYTLYLVIVPAGRDPQNPINWYAAGMSPLFLE
jgi:hypothetical protein